MKRLALIYLALVAFSPAAYASEFNKIASAGGDITEILFAFGVGDKIIATDTTSIYPEEVNALPKIGYVRGLSAEGVLSVRPDLLVGADDMGPPATIDNLQAAGLQVEFAPKGEGAERYPGKVNFIGALLDMEEKAAQLITDYRNAVSAVQQEAAELSKPPRVLVMLSVQDGAPIVGGLGTSANDIVSIAGGQNGASFDGWKPMNAESIIAAQPELIVMTDIHSERMGGTNEIMERPDIGSTPAGQNQSFVVLNAQMLLQFGPRSPQAMQDLLTAFQELDAQ